MVSAIYAPSLNPNTSTEYQRILPQWWRTLYPITYYFVGAYIGEFRPKLPRWGLRLTSSGVPRISQI